MAPRKKARRAAASAETPETGSSVADKIAGALALIAVKGMDKDDAALALDSIGFTAAEVSGLLDVNKNYVMTARFHKKKAKTKKKAS
jgi:hypothetical protein